MPNIHLNQGSLEVKYTSDEAHYGQVEPIWTGPRSSLAFEAVSTAFFILHENPAWYMHSRTTKKQRSTIQAYNFYLQIIQTTFCYLVVYNKLTWSQRNALQSAKRFKEKRLGFFLSFIKVGMLDCDDSLFQFNHLSNNRND